MKKLLFLLFFIPLFFACSDDDNELPCLSCHNINFTNEYTGYDCDVGSMVLCVDEWISYPCFPEGVPYGSAFQPTLSHLNAIKTLWEDNGANCNLN